MQCGPPRCDRIFLLYCHPLPQLFRMRSFHVIGKKIIGVGSNYHCHIKEMAKIAGTNGGEIKGAPSEPIFFLKPTSSYVQEPNPIRIPEGHQIHHEVELGVVIGKGGANIKKENAKNHIAGYCVALDLTARDIQTKAKNEGLPWTIAKGYDTFCPISNYLSRNLIWDHQNVELWLKVNGQLRQKGNTRDMIFPIDELIERISKTMRLDRGDLLLTGTPAGVGPINIGDTIEAGLGHDYVTMRFKVVPKPKVLDK